jgi:predicted dehydrogenase
MSARIGLIGCGNISDIYLRNAALFKDIHFVACADLRPETAKAQAERYQIAPRTVDELLASEDVDIVLNLTVPEAHADVSLAAINAGKHVYTEKPLATRLEDGVRLVEAARAKNLRVGAAPDTVLGAGIQTARQLIDQGKIGKPLLGFAAVLSHGMEHWHPNPFFFFQPGAGPIFDMGPYYLTTLVTLLGPVASVIAAAQSGFAERVITTKTSPHLGQSIKVATPTTAQALLEFHSGAQVTFLASWDVWKHGLPHLELHGTEASLRVPNPNWFGGNVELAEGRGDWTVTSTDEGVYGARNYDASDGKHANYRGLGLAEMARAIAEGRPHRANGDVGLHVLAVMAGILQAAELDRRVRIEQGCERPAALGAAEGKALLEE